MPCPQCLPGYASTQMTPPSGLKGARGFPDLRKRGLTVLKHLPLLALEQVAT